MVENNPVSVIVPVYNEEQNLPILIERLERTFEKDKIIGEIIIVDDGSTDTTRTLSQEISKEYNNIRVLHHRRRKGKTAALQTGFDIASYDIVTMLDADLQYAPEDLPKLLALIYQGYDLVNGYREHRKDSLLKKFPSFIYNFISRIFFGTPFRDFNSGFKVFRHEVFEGINLKKDQHRFILHIAYNKGYRVGEVAVQHFPRKYGKTKYGVSRVILGPLDLISLGLQLAFLERPMVLFGFSGIVLIVLGLFFSAELVISRVVYGESLEQHLARLLLAGLLTIAGIQAFFFGFIADMINDLRSEEHKRKKS